MCVVDISLFSGATPVVHASIKGHVPMLKLLHSHKASIKVKNEKGMFSNSLAILNLFGGRVRLRMLICRVGVILFSGLTPLVFAVSDGHLPVMEWLLENKADIEARDNSGMFLNSATAVLFCVQVHGGCVCLWMLMCVVNVN